MNYIGISCGFHDAGLSVVNEFGDILYAGHSERYSKRKHDKELCISTVQDALTYTKGDHEIHYYERPWLKYLRQVRTGEPKCIANIFTKNVIGLGNMDMLGNKKVHNHNHHLTHAASGFQTSSYAHATCVVIDAIGELDTISIWDAWYDNNGIARYKKIWGKKYPDSIGLMYSAMTARVGLRPLDEEYILMGMAAYGKAIHADKINSTLLSDSTNIDFSLNLHTGISDDFLRDADEMDIAASTQLVTETLIKNVMARARLLGKSDNLVYGGGVALNCLANRLLGEFF